MAGNYYFTTLLGEGSSGTVYRAWDLDNNQEVALKVLHERLAAQTAVVEQFQAEIATLRQLNHPHIISILDSGTIQPPNATIPLPYFATVYRPLGNLRDYLNSYHEHQKRLPVAQALTLARQIADALAHAHAQNILHLDVKPENILLKETKDPDNPVTAVLTDFGLSHHLRTVTRLRIQPGSWPYAAPERVEGLAISPHSDTYALTVLLHLMLVGQLPYPITSQADAYEYLEAPVPPTSLPAPLNAIIQQGMAKQPADRYPAAVALSAALAAALSHPFTDPEPPATLPPPEPVQLAKTVALAEKTFATIEVGNRIDTAQTWQKPSEYRLLIAHEDERDRIVYLDKGLIRIGRHPSNDICLNNEYVSAYHAVLERTPGRKWQVLDKGSDNKTYIDDNPLQDSDQPTPWESKQTLRIGPYFLQWQDVAHLQKNGHDQPSIPIPRTTSPDDALVELTLSAAKLELKPGQTAVLTLSVKNKSHASGHYHLSLEGSDLPITWQNPTEPLKLLTNATGSVDIPLTALPGSAGRAGQYPCKAVVRLSDGTILTDDTLQLTIPAEARLVADMHPSYVLHGTTTQIRLDNQGNTPQTYRLLARDSADKLLFYPNPERVVTVQNGVSLAENFEVRAKRRPIIPKSQIIPFTVDIFSAPDKQETKSGQLEVLPYLPLWACVLMLLMIGGLIWGWREIQARRSEYAADVQALEEENKQQQATIDEISLELATNKDLTASDRAELEARLTATQAERDETTAKLTSASEKAGQLDSLLNKKPPEFVQKPKTEAEQDQLYQTVVTASDPDGDPTTVKASVLPGWLSATQKEDGSLELNGTPLNEHVGSHSITLQAQTGDESPTTNSFTIVVANKNDPPEITSEPILTVLEDTPYRYNLTATDPDLSTPDKDTLTFSLVQAPGWLQGKLVDKGNGTAVLSGTPTNEDVGKHTVTIEVTDAGGLKNQETHTFVITVENANSLPTIDSLPVGSAVEEGNYGYCIHVTDLDPNEKFDFDQSAIPSWLEIVIPASNADCQSGTATAVLKNKDTLDDIHVGTHKITLVVKDSQEGLATQTFDLTVTNVDEAPVLDATSCPDAAKEDEPYRCVVLATDPDNNIPGATKQTLTFPIEPNNSWLKPVTDPAPAAGTAVFAGTPLQADVGSSSFKITATDDKNLSDMENLAIQVVDTPDQPIITHNCLDLAMQTTPSNPTTYRCTITIAEEDTDKTFNFTNILPSWLEFNNNNNLQNKAGHPNNDDVGTHTVVIGGKDNDNLTATVAFIVTVTNANDPPAFAQLPTSFTGSDAELAFIAPTGLITDPDVFAPGFSLEGAELTATISNGAQDTDELKIRPHDHVLQLTSDKKIMFRLDDANPDPLTEIGGYEFNNRKLTVTFTSSANLAAATAVLQRIYLDYGSEPHTPRTITLQINDGAATADEKIIVGNTAPTLSTNGTPKDIQTNGSTVNYILKLNTGSPIYSDDDEDAAGVDYYEPGIAIIDINGTWQFKCQEQCGLGNTTDWQDIPNVSATMALHLNKDAQIRFNGTPANGQTPSITFRAWDQSNGVVNGESQTIPILTESSAYSIDAKIANLQ